MLEGHSLALVAVGPGDTAGGFGRLISEGLLPVYQGRYISVSSRWWRLMRKGVLLTMVVLVKVTLGVSYLLGGMVEEVCLLFIAKFRL